MAGCAAGHSLWCTDRNMAGLWLVIRCTLGLWTLLALGPRLVVRCQQTYCDASCQSAQLQALVSLYTATGGPAWQATSSLIDNPAGWPNPTATTAYSLPKHCTWSGISPSLAHSRPCADTVQACENSVSRSVVQGCSAVSRLACPVACRNSY